MSYIKQTWETGDTITAEKLNHIEDGIDDASRHLSDKQDAPSTAGTAGQVLGLDSNLNPAWVNQSGGGLTSEIKQALLQIASKVAYIDDDGADYYQDLYDALYSGSLLGIDAVYTQSGVVFTTDTLDYLKSDLVVTAHYSSGDVVVSDYTMSGTLTAGTSTVTVSYGGMTDTFTVIVKQSTQPVIEYENAYLYKGDGAGVPQPTAKEYAGVTTKYPITATTKLHPAGVIVQDGLFGTNRGTLAIYNGDTYVNYVDEVNRWAKAPAESYTEYNSKSWTVNQYDGIIFSLDMRYLDDSYMYDYTTGAIWFAGRNTRYAGMQNVSEAV